MNAQKYQDLKSQFLTSNKHGGRRHLPYVFTEQGIAMLSAILRSETAIKTSIKIMQAFVNMRKLMAKNAGFRVTNHSGFVLPEEQFERRVASTNLSNYKIVMKGKYAYNPSRINVGSIARLDDWDVGVLSPMYIVFSLDEQKVSSDYFLHWLSSNEAKQRIKNSAQGSVCETVSFSDLGTIPIPLPSMATQMRIAKILNVAKSEINLFKQLARQYHTQKRGLMQKLLTGEWGVKVGRKLCKA